MSTSPTSPRPSVIQLAIKEKAALYAAYIPMFAEGGIFIPTGREYKLGDDIYVLLSLPEDPQRYPVAEIAATAVRRPLVSRCCHGDCRRGASHGLGGVSTVGRTASTSPFRPPDRAPAH